MKYEKLAQLVYDILAYKDWANGNHFTWSPVI
jgi:hypothetical protein